MYSAYEGYRSLRAMISQFVFFIGIAAICFSGLLFTLWTLGQWHYWTWIYCIPTNGVSFAASDNPVGPTPWTFKSIAWLMVQIWFGNTYLSFAQAASFHPLFGPILMTIFAALSNTLLLTSEYASYITKYHLTPCFLAVLISILSNTVARIDAVSAQLFMDASMPISGSFQRMPLKRFVLILRSSMRSKFNRF